MTDLPDDIDATDEDGYGIVLRRDDEHTYLFGVQANGGDWLAWCYVEPEAVRRFFDAVEEETGGCND